MTPERLAWFKDVFHTALEGGIGYWSECYTYDWQDRDDFVATINTIEDEDTILSIVPETLRKGFKLYREGYEVDGYGPKSGRVNPEFLVSYDTYDMYGDYDAGDADVIVQLGLFGKVVYG